MIASRYVRARLKHALARGLWGPQRGLMLAALSRRRVPLVVGYHRVVSDEDGVERAMPGLAVSLRMFAQQVAWLAEHFRLVTVDAIADRLEGRDADTDPVAAITFDDGYREVYEVALPLLGARGIPACVFVVADLLATAEAPIHDRLYARLGTAFELWRDAPGALLAMIAELGVLCRSRPPTRDAVATPYRATSWLLPRLSRVGLVRLFERLDEQLPPAPGGAGAASLSWEMARALVRAGFTIGSHTRSHCWLACESPARIASELQGARQVLEAGLQVPVRHFAYPGGQFTPAVVDAVRQAGYRTAFTVCAHEHPSSRTLAVPRVMLWEGSSVDATGRFSPAILGCQTHGWFIAARGCPGRPA